MSLISLFTDIASEMLYPVMPVYLESIGFSVVLIGILEGIAEATAGLCKGYFGKMSDSMGKRVPFVRLGYALGAVSKPLMAVFTYPLWIFFARTIDRFGKGLRTGARDAMLSDESSPETRGKVFGFHRSMDTFGAVLGPVAALIYLSFYPNDYRTLFLIAFIPGLWAISVTFLIKDKKREQTHAKPVPSFFSFIRYWKVSSPLYRKVVAGLLVFALFNSSDMLLLLKVKESGVSDINVISLYIFFNLVYALTSWPIGVLADKFSLKTVLLAGFSLFAAVYAAMAFTSNLLIYFIIFSMYGLYYAATEGISKAWISKISKKEDTATAIGFLSGFQSIALMIASSLTGLIWYKFGAMLAFGLTGFMTLCVILYFLFFVRGDISNLNEEIIHAIS